jgi:hypothetical protein
VTSHGLAVLGQLKTLLCTGVSFDFRHWFILLISIICWA